MRRFVLNLLLRTHRPPSIFWFSKLYTGHHKHLVSKARRSCTWKGKKVFGLQPSKAGTSELGIVHKSTFFCPQLKQEKKSAAHQFIFPSWEKKISSTHKSNNSSFTTSCCRQILFFKYLVLPDVWEIISRMKVVCQFETLGFVDETSFHQAGQSCHAHKWKLKVIALIGTLPSEQKDVSPFLC